jgi:CHAD domain-containing protein
VNADAKAPTTFVPAGADAFDARRVAAVLGVVAAASRTVERVWYDTFDWRVWDAGRALEVDSSAAGTEATLRDRRDHAVVWTQPVGVVPRTARELPAGQWRRTLADVIGRRALIPVARAEVAVTAMTVTDANEKGVAHVLFEEMQIGSGSVRTVRIEAARGYGAAGRAAARRLERDAGMTPSGSHPLEFALPAGRQPGDGASALPRPLDGAMRSDEATRLLLKALLATMRANEPWLIDAPDTEFLHDYRIALRRSRSILKQAGGVISPQLLHMWRPALRDVQQRTNVHRDLDVFLDSFEQYRAAVPEEFGDDLESLRDLIRERLAEEHDALVGVLRSKKYQRVVDGYARALEGPLSDDSCGDAARPIGDVARDRIRRAHRRLLRRGREVTATSPSAELHAVRIAAKELRYLLELYGDLYRPTLLKPIRRELRRLQDNLGEFQDSEVHVRQVAAFAEELQGSKHAPARSLMAVGFLREAFAQRQQHARAEFASRFAHFDAKRIRARLQRLLSDGRSAARE